jgi:hypothetical protein
MSCSFSVAISASANVIEGCVFSSASSRNLSSPPVTTNLRSPGATEVLNVLTRARAYYELADSDLQNLQKPKRRINPSWQPHSSRLVPKSTDAVGFDVEGSRKGPDRIPRRGRDRGVVKCREPHGLQYRLCPVRADRVFQHPVGPVKNRLFLFRFVIAFHAAKACFMIQN